MTKHVHPVMSIQDIIASLESWGMPVEEERLLRPTPEFVENVLCRCLTQVTGISREQLVEPAQDALSVSTIDEKDIYTSALTHNLLLYHLCRFADAARIDDFSAIDLLKPTKDRVILLLSAFINFVKFTEQLCEEAVRKLSAHSEAILTERDQAAKDLHEVEGKIRQLKAKIAEDEPLCEELRAKNNALGLQMMQKKGQQEREQTEFAKLKEEKRELSERKKSIIMEIDAVSDANRRIRGRIVQSPERVKRSISTMSTSTFEYKKTVAANEMKARDLQAKINALIIVEQDLCSCVDQLQVVEKETKSLQELQVDLAELKDQLDDKKIERNELRLKQERVTRQLDNAHAKLTLTQQRAADKKAANDRVIKQLQMEYDEMDVERKENELQLAEVRNEADEVEEKMSEHLKAGEEELKSLLAEYWKLRHATHFYMETLANQLNMKVER
ncbi:Nuf2 family-domain-containing protein [Rhodocollybia butyracea]|uniref:Nuf2 family-domain-containing protein n=1 Tax=Rhodocollybia butyracea TaxID=206335 RepID=A0A9P5PRX5_9AGAR|nr:Nuf2 family-domain-containing protein [Rhodocollybia butyracea]